MSSAKNKLRIIVLLTVIALVSLSLVIGCTPEKAATDKPADTTQTAAVEGGPFVSDEQCLSCHGGTYEEFAGLAAELGDWNPHDSIDGGYNSCVNCHEADKVISYNYRSKCHVYTPEAEPIFLLDVAAK